MPGARRKAARSSSVTAATGMRGDGYRRRSRRGDASLGPGLAALDRERQREHLRRVAEAGVGLEGQAGGPAPGAGGGGEAPGGGGRAGPRGPQRTARAGGG